VNRQKLAAAVFLSFVMTSVFAKDALAGEAYFYHGESQFSASFFLIGGQYSLYVNARRPIRGYNTPEAQSCIFGGDLQRVWPTQDALSLGAGITISTIVPHKIGPKPLTMPAGLYRVYIAPLTTCDWKFVLSSTENPAGLAPVQMFRFDHALSGFPDIASVTASVKEQVQLCAQYRTERNAQAPVSGVVQIIHEGKVVQTFPLHAGLAFEGSATALYANVQWGQSDLNYLGTNTAKFVVKIGNTEFTSTGEFTLTQ
jgi:hypothetical protein